MKTLGGKTRQRAHTTPRGPKTPGPGGAPPLDPSGVTDRREVTKRESEQVTQASQSLKKPSKWWLRDVEKLTRDVRFERAGRLRARGKEVSKRRRKEWRRSNLTARDGDRRLRNVPKVHPWHAQRAAGAEEHFRRVETCGEQWAAVARCPSTSCVTARRRGDAGAGVRIRPCGCGSRFFCEECRLRLALRFRRDFNAARLGLMWKARSAGLTGRWLPRGERFGERLITLTAPHVGTARDRVKWMRAAFHSFNRKLREHRLAGLGREKAGLCEYARFFEWTDGDDGDGHPHWHVWDFGPFIDAELLTAWWHHAWHGASRRDDPMLRVDVRAVAGDVLEGGETRIDRELVKYLTKSWGGDARAFADVYAELVGKRARQSSAGFYDWSVELVHVCERCALVLDDSEVKWTREPVAGSPTDALLHYTPSARAPPPIVGAVFADVAGHIREEQDEHDFEWLERTRGLRANLRARLTACYSVLQCDSEVSHDTDTAETDWTNRGSDGASGGRWVRRDEERQGVFPFGAAVARSGEKFPRAR